ncbi:AIR synthase-related protein [Halobacillus salinarum]|uniref:AIR synthase-related protein n=1 Tax=Halobacillus salinarum TaxID=2932257 RepID=UPI0029624F37|nr:AIR synthase-related protein [Halobacillus salinarum]
MSDGIANEANEIAEASHVDLQLDLNKIPHSTALRTLFPDDYHQWMLRGGEDFELLGTVAKEDWASVQKAADDLKLPVHEIGHVEKPSSQSGQVFLNENGQVTTLKKAGYTHLQGGEN